jgi:YidC/Oxa1 family membrane protein insertase
MDFLTNPFATALVFLYQLLGGNIVLTIVLFTVIIRFLVFPLTWQQPEFKELKEKYKNDREKLAQAQMELYRKHGVNPVAGCLPLIVQLPILLGLYGAISVALASSPLQVLDISHRLLLPNLASLIPLDNKFFIWNLGQPDTTFILPVLVVVSSWVQQKLIMPIAPDADPKDPQVQMSRQMLVMMPLMTGLFALQVASGMSIYWIIGNIIIVIQYALLGKVDVYAALGIKKPAGLTLQPAGVVVSAGATSSEAVLPSPVVTVRPKKLEAGASVSAEKSEKPVSKKAAKTAKTTVQTFDAKPKSKK